MRLLSRIVILIIFVAFVIMQFFQPDKNINDDSTNHIFNVEKVPPDVKQILKSACLDCHSDQTSYKWYHKPAPVSWMINDHIVDGKDELNLSEWGQFDIYDKITTLEEICEETKRRTMPLKSYRFVHSDAKLSDEQISILCSWSEILSKELLSKMAE